MEGREVGEGGRRVMELYHEKLKQTKRKLWVSTKWLIPPHSGVRILFRERGGKCP